MTIQKKFLHCTMLLVLSPLFIGSASATSITNLDEVPHNITLNIAGENTTITLMPYKRFFSRVYPIKVQYDGYLSPALQPRGSYSLWKGGTLSLQRRGYTGRGAR